MHQQLVDYLSPATPPTSITAPGGALGARQPVQPGGQIPKGHRPVPTTTETIKKTNAQIPYVRQVTQEQGVAGRWRAPQEGDIVMVERANLHRKMEHPAARLGHGTNSYAFARTLEQVNAQLAEDEAERASPYTYETFPWRLDGVINNTDSADPENEYRDYAISNVAVYGPVRLDHRPERRCCDAKTLPGTTLYVGLLTRGIAAYGTPYYEHKLARFSALQIARGSTKEVFASGGWNLVCAWRLGMVMDSAQSEGMITACVDVEPVRAVGDGNASGPIMQADVEPYQWVGGAAVHVLRRDGSGAPTKTVAMRDEIKSPRNQLLRRWGHFDASTGTWLSGAPDAVARDRNYPV
jgi:hypothetical protein